MELKSREFDRKKKSDLTVVGIRFDFRLQFIGRDFAIYYLGMKLITAKLIHFYDINFYVMK